jgi:hypothetical protein
LRGCHLPGSVPLLHLTRGERRWALAHGLMALYGAGVGLIAAVRLGHGGSIDHGLGLYDAWIILAAALGGICALWVLRARFGHPGLSGVHQALIGGLGISLLGPVIAGTLALPIYGTMFGPFTLAVILAGTPFLALCWVSALALVHHLMMARVAERDSIFAARA